MSKKILQIFVLALGLCSLTHVQAQSVLLNYFNINADGADILLEWEVQDETDIVEFQMFRKFNGEPSQAHVTTLKPSGNRTYQYLDDDIFKTSSRVITILTGRPECLDSIMATGSRYTLVLPPNPPPISAGVALISPGDIPINAAV